MEPITYLSILIFMYLVNQYGKDAIVAIKKQIQKTWQHIFHNRNILILGPGCSGKSTLVYMLMHGKPYIEKNGQRLPPEPTFIQAVVDRQFNFTKEQRAKWFKLSKDVAGDKIEVVSQVWKELIHDTDPDGIIYIMDGGTEMNKFKEDGEDLFNRVLDEYQNRSGSLKVVHVFLNFADRWAGDNRVIIDRKESAIRQYFYMQIEKEQYKFIKHIAFHVSTVQLAPNKNAWPEVKQALGKFAADFID